MNWIDQRKKTGFKLPEPIGEITHFTWGPVVKVHHIGRIHIIEFHPMIFENSHGTGKYEKEITQFHHIVDGQDDSTTTHTLEQSIVYALAQQVHGKCSNRQAAYYACKILDLIGPDDE